MLICWHQYGCSGAGVQTDGKTALANGLAAAHSRDGSPECDMERGTHRRELKLKLGIRVSPCTVGKYLRVGRVSVREYLRRCAHPCRTTIIDTASLQATLFDVLPFSATTMSSGSRKWRREARIDFLRSTPHSDLLCGMGSFVTKESQART